MPINLLARAGRTRHFSSRLAKSVNRQAEASTWKQAGIRASATCEDKISANDWLNPSVFFGSLLSRLLVPNAKAGLGKTDQITVASEKKGYHLGTEGHRSCDRGLVSRYVRNELTGDALLDFLLHVDGCRSCQNTVFLERQRQDARYYKDLNTSPSAGNGCRRRRKAS